MTTFLAKADGLKKKGPLAMFSGDLKRLMNQVKSDSIQLRADNAAATALASGLAPVSVDPNFQSGRVQTWNVNVERQIGPALGVMVGYFGSKGDRLRIARNLNQLVNGVRPFPTLSGVPRQCGLPFDCGLWKVWRP